MLLILLLEFAGFVAAVAYLMSRARAFARRSGPHRAWRFAPAGVLVVACLSMLYLFVVVLGAFSGESVDPSQKARVLAEGISGLMNDAALLVMAFVAAALLVLVGSRLRRRPR